jgi:hypothetical protein
MSNPGAAGPQCGPGAAAAKMIAALARHARRSGPQRGNRPRQSRQPRGPTFPGTGDGPPPQRACPRRCRLGIGSAKMTDLCHILSEQPATELGIWPKQIRWHRASFSVTEEGRSGDRRTQEHQGWYSRGYLPHFDSPFVIQHITYRLVDSLPNAMLERMQAEATTIRDDKERKAARAPFPRPRCIARRSRSPLRRALREQSGQSGPPARRVAARRCRQSRARLPCGRGRRSRLSSRPETGALWSEVLHVRQ